MAQQVLTLIIDRETDPETAIVTALLDGVALSDKYFMDSVLTDEEIRTYIRTDLINKGYDIGE